MRRLQKLPLLIGPLALAACATSHEFRVASVGDETGEATEFASGPGGFPVSPGVVIPPASPGAGVPGSPSGGNPAAPGAPVTPGVPVTPGMPGVPGVPAASGGTTPPLIVASGNVLLGAAGRLASGGALNAAAGVVNGTVSAVLLTTTQTVVQIADGSSVLVDGLGGSLGDAVSIDLAQGQVVGGPKGLVGNTLPTATGAAGRVLGATALAGRSGSNRGRSSGGGSGTLPANVGQVLSPVTGVTSVLQPAVPVPPLLPIDP